MKRNKRDIFNHSIAIFKKRWKIFGAIFLPALLIPILYVTNGKEGKAAYVCILMMISWVLNLIPLAITALLPIVLFPFFDILGTDEVSRIYLSDTVTMFFVSLSMAVAFEHSNLHRRIALRVLISSGKSVNKLMMGFIATTAFLSLWISNTATTAMMISIAEATMQELEMFRIGEDMGMGDRRESAITYSTETSQFEYSDSDLPTAENSEDSKLFQLMVKQSENRYVESSDIENPENNNHKNIDIKKSQDHYHKEKKVLDSKHYSLEKPSAASAINHDPENQTGNTDLDTEISKTETTENILFDTSQSGLSVISSGQFNLPSKTKRRKRRPRSAKKRFIKKKISKKSHKSNKSLKSKDKKRKDKSKDEEIVEQKDVIHRMKFALFFSIACSANIGGTATTYGTVTNIAFIHIFKKQFPESHELTYRAWFLYNVPTVLISLTIAWGYLVTIGTNNKEFLKTDNEEIKRIVKLHYSELGTITFHEIAFAILLTTLLLLWVLRESDVFGGWESLINSKVDVQNATPSVAIFILLFVIPARPTELCRSPPLLSWKILKYNLRWGIIIFIGGALAMAEGAEKSGLSIWVAKKLLIFETIAEEGLVIIVSFVALLVTGVFSNVAVAKIMIIVVDELSLALKVNPLYLLIPVMLCCSYSFMSPAGTPPNAIVYEAAHMKLKEMAIPGLVLALSCYIVQLIMISTLGTALFNLRTFPSWAEKRQNFTIM